jgi:hypothetical protein
VLIKSDLKEFLNYTPTMHINAVHPSSPNSSLSEDDAAVKIQAGWKGYKVRKQLKTRKNKNSQNGTNKCENVTIEEKSAAKIQAGWKGFKIRKELKNAREAATKIQASYRGFRARKELKTKCCRDGYSKKSQ